MLGLVTVVLGGSLLGLGELRWHAPASCPSAAAMHERVDALVGEDALGEDVIAEARVAARADGWDLELALMTREGTSVRRMSSRDCTILAEAVVLVVATLADPVGTVARVPVESAMNSPSPSPPARPPHESAQRPGSPVPSPSLASATRSPSRVRGQWGLRLGVAAGHATQADLDLGPDTEVSWQRGYLRIALGAVGLAPRTWPVDGREGASLRTWTIAGRLRIGVVLPLGSRWEVPISAGLELGPMVARGQGIDRPHRVVSPWLAAVVSAHAGWWVTPRFGPWAGLDGVFGLARPQFTVAGAGPWAAGPSGVRGLAGIQWRFVNTNSGRGGH